MKNVRFEMPCSFNSLVSVFKLYLFHKKKGKEKLHSHCVSFISFSFIRTGIGK